MKPPNIYFLTPNGRFEVGKKICLSITGFHPEFWRPAWGVRTTIVAIISFFMTKGEGAIGALDWSVEDRKRTALLSQVFPTLTPRHGNAAFVDLTTPLVCRARMSRPRRF
jgi:hypothetical protein